MGRPDPQGRRRLLPLLLVLADAPLPGQLGFQDPATDSFFSIGHLHHSIWGWLCFVLLLVGLLLFLILYCFWQHQLRYGLLTPAERLAVTVDHQLEFGWTLLPMGILLFIAVPSLSLLYALEELEGAASLIIQVVGRQWYWVYEYPSFAANLLEVEPLETEAELRDPLNREYPRLGVRLLDSTPLLLPMALEVEFLTASEDVIHSFALPSAGLKLDAVPGRLNQALSTLLRPGILYGQCSELCGSGHGFMPITAQVMVEPLFQLNMLEKADLLQDYLNSWLAEVGSETVTTMGNANQRLAVLMDEYARQWQSTNPILDSTGQRRLILELMEEFAREYQAGVAAGAEAINAEPGRFTTLARNLPYQWPEELLEHLRPLVLLEPNMGPLQRNTPWELPSGVALRSAAEGGFWMEYLQLVPLRDHPGGFGPLLHRVFLEGEENAESVRQGLERLLRMADEALERPEAERFSLVELVSAFFFDYSAHPSPVSLLQHPFMPEA